MSHFLAKPIFLFKLSNCLNICDYNNFQRCVRTLTHRLSCLINWRVFPSKHTRKDCYCQRIYLGLPGGKKPSTKLDKQAGAFKCNTVFQSKALIYMSYPYEEVKTTEGQLEFNKIFLYQPARKLFFTGKHLKSVIGRLSSAFLMLSLRPY